jgi:glycosyltransferase involved in cell wall biosynthesis
LGTVGEPIAMTRMLHLRVVTGTGGGPEKTILNSPRFIRRHGYEAEVAYLVPPNDPISDSLLRRAEQAECPLTLIPDRGPGDLRVVRDVLRICRHKKIQLLQTHDYKTNAIGLLVRRFHRCKMASMLHGWTDMSGRMPLYKKVDQWCLPFYEKLICVSQDLVEECRRLGIPGSKLYLVHNAIDLGAFTRSKPRDQAKQEMGAATDRILVGSVGRLSEEKGFLPLIEVVHELQLAGMPIDLWIAGDGPQRTALQQRIQELRLSGTVRLLGQIQDPRAFYQAMDLFVLNSVREGLPNVLLEAMAFEVPVIATRIAGIPDLVQDGTTGRLIEPTELESLEAAIRASLDQKDATHRMVTAARRRIEDEYSFDVRMVRVAAIYDEFMEAS